MWTMYRFPLPVVVVVVRRRIGPVHGLAPISQGHSEWQVHDMESPQSMLQSRMVQIYDFQ